MGFKMCRSESDTHGRDKEVPGGTQPALVHYSLSVLNHNRCQRGQRSVACSMLTTHSQYSITTGVSGDSVPIHAQCSQWIDYFQLPTYVASANKTNKKKKKLKTRFRSSLPPVVHNPGSTSRVNCWYSGS